MPTQTMHDLTAFDRIYAIGDIHGRHDLLLALEDGIRDDLAATRPRAPAIVHLGDYIDRGPDSRAVIEHLARPEADLPPQICLMGNHEDRMLDFLDGEPEEHGPAWVRFGGREAMESYGLSVPSEASARKRDWRRLRDELAAVLPAHHRAFLDALALFAPWRDHLFVHAGINPGKPLAAQSRRDLLWIRDPFQDSTRDHGFIVVHGHVPGPEPVVRRNRIGLDTQAYASGRLTCGVFGDGAVRFLQTNALRRLAPA